MESVRLSITFITRNEAHQLERSLRSAAWADEIVVVDSESTDGTRELADKLGARVFNQPWQGFGKQKNIAQDHARNDWVLNLDADEVLTDELVAEIRDWLARQEKRRLRGDIPGLLAVPRKNFYREKWIRFGGWYPNTVVRLGHKSNARWTEPHLHERLEGRGNIDHARNPLLHYTFRSIAHQVSTNLRYAQEGSRELRRKGAAFSALRLLLKPIGKFLETYVWKLGFLDGRLGFIISVNAAHSMFLKQAFLLESDEGHRP
jgi:glycosyltransferase involved in cell wall biosynthesis